MELNIDTLLTKLKCYKLSSYIYSNNKTLINDAKLLSKYNDTDKSDILYVGKASEILSILPLKGVVNILCIADCIIPQEKIYNSKSNWIIIDENTELIEIYEKVQDIIEHCKKMDKYSAKFLNALIEGKGIQHIIDIGFELLGNPMFVTDNINRVLAYTKNVQVDDPDWNRIVGNGYVSFNVVTSIKGKELVEIINSSKSPVITDPGDKKIPILRTAIRNKNKPIGQLTIPGNFKPFCETDIEKAALIGNILSLEIQKNKLICSSNPSMLEYFITDLLDGKIKDHNIFKEEMKFLNYQLKSNIYVLVIRAKQYYTENTSQIDITESIKKLLRDTIVVIYNDDIILVASSNRKSFQIDIELKGLIQLLVENQLHAGVSRYFHSLLDIQDYYKQAVKAIELGYLKNKQKVLYLYENYTIYHLMEVCASQEDIKKFCHPSLIVLQKYDYKNGTDFMKTLYCYLTNDKNLVKSGNMLHIHRNTMSYRIKKIQNIMNLNLNDDDIPFYLLLSFKMLEFIRNT